MPQVFMMVDQITGRLILSHQPSNQPIVRGDLLLCQRGLGATDILDIPLAALRR
jgi:hypothetical protein